MSTEIVEQLETQVVAMQFSLCNKQKQMQDYFTRTEPRSRTPFKSVADVSADISIVESLDMDDMELESIDTTVASVATSVLMKETLTQFSTPKRPRPPASESSTPVPQPSTSTSSQPPAKKIKLGLSWCKNCKNIPLTIPPPPPPPPGVFPLEKFSRKTLGRVSPHNFFDQMRNPPISNSKPSPVCFVITKLIA